MQINDIFGSRGITPPSAALLVIEIVDGQQIAVYATLTDNVINDSTYLNSSGCAAGELTRVLVAGGWLKVAGRQFAVVAKSFWCRVG